LVKPEKTNKITWILRWFPHPLDVDIFPDIFT